VSLKSAVLALGVVAAVAGAALLIVGAAWGAGLWLIAFGAAVILSTALESWRYRQRAPSPGTRWERTGERFEDPTTGEPVEVFYDRASGERRYVRAGESPPNADV
jgi:hypothetical protein